mmetsp:Transcript_58391/g.102239  ORF Transcript_58391/g.102239 Transcript_58391/m.102239 type:complete len:125 (-) Transcript_58391:544-918(-)
MTGGALIDCAVGTCTAIAIARGGCGVIAITLGTRGAAAIAVATLPNIGDTAAAGNCVRATAGITTMGDAACALAGDKRMTSSVEDPQDDVAIGEEGDVGDDGKTIARTLRNKSMRGSVPTSAAA